MALLTLSSLIFYSFSGLAPLLALIFAVLIAYLFINFVSIQNFSLRVKKYLLFFTCLLIALPFIVIKYLFPGIGWFAGLIESTTLHQVSILTSDILLPAGISFYTFQLLTSVIDAHKKEKTHITFSQLLGYASFFPQLIAGPIVRVQELLPQLRALSTKRRNNSEYVNDVSCGLKLIAFGLILKTLISDVLNTFYRNFFVDEVKFFDSIFIVLSKSVIIYADFWGYSAIAIGLALLFGIKLPRNFLQPYHSRNIQEFWRRWHVTLSRWFADYVYIPTGGRQNYIFSISIVFMFVGVWHGYGAQFLLWGFLHGLSLMFFVGFIKGRNSYILSSIAPLITFTWISILWVLFFFSFKDSMTIYTALLNFDLTLSSANIVSATRWLYLSFCLAIVFLINDDILFDGSRHNFEKTPISVDKMLQTNDLEIKLDSIPPAILPAFSLKKNFSEPIARFRGFFTHMIDGFLIIPYVVPFVIMATMLFFSFRTTFVYFRF
jgi:alginate O-acetyltransferase complex protein AlgI